MALDPQIQSVIDHLDALGNTPVDTLSPAKARLEATPADAVRALLWQEGTSLAPEPVGATEDLDVPAPHGSVPVRIYWPLGADPGPLPVLVYAHGGGWVLGDLDDYDATPRALTNRSGCIVVSVDYRLAPEHPFAAAHDDMVAATRWVIANIGRLSGDPARVAVGGEGAGATMALATCRTLRESGQAQPVFQLLLYPITDLDRVDWPSYRENVSTRPLASTTIAWFASHVVADGRDLVDPRLSPARYERATLAAMPASLVITADHDPLRDQGEAFGRLLLDAGVNATTLRFEGVTHDFLTMNPVADQAQRAVSTASEQLRGAFRLKGAAAPTVAPDLAQVFAADLAGMRTLLSRLEQGRGDRSLLSEQLGHALSARAGMEQAVTSDAETRLSGLPDVDSLLLLLGPEAVTGTGFLAGVEMVRTVVDAHCLTQETELANLRNAVGNVRMRELGKRVLDARKSSEPHRTEMTAARAGS